MRISTLNLKFARQLHRMNKQTKQILFVALLVLSMAALRVVNTEMHWYNLVPVAALGLFSGSVVNRKWSVLIPLGAMFLSDLGLSLFTQTPGFYGISQWVNYIALALVTILGMGLQQRNTVNVLGYTLSGSLLFFVLSNFGTWLGGFYGYTTEGLVQCFTMAIPFYKSELSTTFFMNSLMGDMLFSVIAFTAYNFYSRSLQTQTV